MESQSTGAAPYQSNIPPPERGWDKFKKLVGPLAVVGILLAKFKGLLIPLLKFFPILLKTGGTMILSIWAYSLMWGWKFAAGFVILIFIHELGHLIAARHIGLKVGAPVFIPFMGALIALKEAPKNAWIEAQVGIGGPLLGAVASALCMPLAHMTGNHMFMALAYTGFFLNLFNLAPIGFLDGGRIVTALSPWLWIVGLVIVVGMIFVSFNFLLLLILILSLPRVFSLFRKKTEEEVRYFEVTPSQRLSMGALYFGLAAALAYGMKLTHVVMR